MPLFQPIYKAPADVLQAVPLDWSPLLPSGATITASSFTTDDLFGNPDNSLTVTDASTLPATSTAFDLSGGQAGTGPQLVNTVTLSTGATLQRRVTIIVRCL